MGKMIGMIGLKQLPNLEIQKSTQFLTFKMDYILFNAFLISFWNVIEKGDK